MQAVAADSFDMPELTVRLTPTQAYLQQQIVQTVQLISSRPFEALELELPPISGTAETTLIKRRVRRSKTYGFDGYIYETARAIFPQTSGRLTVPAVRISGAVGLSANAEAQFVRQTRETTVEVKSKPQSYSAPWLVANAVEISDEWSVPVDTLRIGDTVRRTVRVVVDGVTGEHLPDLQHRAGHLITLPAGSERRTEITSSGVIGHLTQSFDIAFTAENPVDFAPVVVDWWDAATQAGRRTALAAKRIEPLPRDVDALVAEQMARAEEIQKASQYTRWLLAGVLVLTATAILIGFHAGRDRASVRAISRNEDPATITKALYAWNPGRIAPDGAAAFAARIAAMDEAGQQSLARLQNRAFGEGGCGLVDRSVRRSLAASLTKLARQHRWQRWRNRSDAWISRILGPIRRLPQLDNQPQKVVLDRDGELQAEISDSKGLSFTKLYKLTVTQD